LFHGCFPPNLLFFVASGKAGFAISRNPPYKGGTFSLNLNERNAPSSPMILTERTGAAIGKTYDTTIDAKSHRRMAD
ncbi:MAG: hypothetical protein ACPICA_05680, partial [Candidatus Puniceispirillaceae bacterium]